MNRTKANVISNCLFLALIFFITPLGISADTTKSSPVTFLEKTDTPERDVFGTTFPRQCAVYRMLAIPEIPKTKKIKIVKTRDDQPGKALVTASRYNKKQRAWVPPIFRTEPRSDSLWDPVPGYLYFHSSTPAEGITSCDKPLEEDAARLFNGVNYEVITTFRTPKKPGIRGTVRVGEDCLKVAKALVIARGPKGVTLKGTTDENGDYNLRIKGKNLSKLKKKKAAKFRLTVDFKTKGAYQTGTSLVSNPPADSIILPQAEAESKANPVSVKVKVKRKKTAYQQLLYAGCG